MRWLPIALVLVATPAAADELALKADAFRAAIHERHLSREGLLLYRVDLRTIERDLERGAYPENADGPTFNGLYAGAACARAESSAGETREQALADATQALAGLELQMAVTGVQGLLARGARRAPPHARASGEWHAARAPYEGWWWRGDASMDQYANGLVSAVGLCRRVFPERARALARDAAEHLLANDFQLTDPDGQRTRYGDLSWRSGFGWNSIAQLTGYAIVSLAAALEPDPRFAAAREELRDRRRVPARAKLTNARILGITNHSNDLMAFDLYRVLVPLARETGDPALADLRHGLARAWLRVRPDRNAFFALIYCELEPLECDPAELAAARDLLARFPLDKRKLEPSAELAGIERRWLPGRKWKKLTKDVVPIELRQASSFEWKSSPYRAERDAAPHTEYTGLDYLVAYWLYEQVCAARGDCPRPAVAKGQN